MSGFFGFDSALPERRDQPPHQQQQPFGGFQASNADQAFGLGHGNQGEDEDLAVYTWGQGGSLMEGGDDMNDETFGDFGEVGEWLARPVAHVTFRPLVRLDTDNQGNNFQFSSQPVQPQPKTQKIASTASRYKPKAAYDPFAASEDDFYAARPATKSKPKCSELDRGC